MYKSVMISSLLIAALATVGQEQSGPDLAAIERTALDYGRGWYEADAERMEQALHPDLSKRIFKPDRRTGEWGIEGMSAADLIQATEKGGGSRTPSSAQKTKVTVLDVFGNAASVKLEMHDWVDYMHLSKINGRWVIVNVLWEFTEDAKKKYGLVGNP